MRHYGQSSGVGLETLVRFPGHTLPLTSNEDLGLCFLLSGPLFLCLLNGDNSSCSGTVQGSCENQRQALGYGYQHMFRE